MNLVVKGEALFLIAVIILSREISKSNAKYFVENKPYEEIIPSLDMA